MTITEFELKLIRTIIELHISDYSDTENEMLKEIIKTILEFDA